MAPKILLVEDDKAVQEFAKTVLEDAGFEIITADNVAEGLEGYKTHKPDLVICDVGLPDGNGIDVCKQIMATEGNKSAVIFLTGHSELNTRLECFRAGAQDYIQKPIALQELLARVRVHLKIQNTQDSLRKKNYELELHARARQDLTDMIVHDLKTPLTSIQGTLELVKSNGMISDSAYNNLIDHAGDAAEFMLLMVNDLLDIGQDQQVGLKAERVKVETAPIVSRLRGLFETRFKRRNAKLNDRLSGILQSLKTDPNLFFRILANLIANALQATPSGGDVDLDGVRTNGSARITVSDRGPGVPEESKKAIFDKFTTTKRQGGGIENRGSGIGLAFCNKAAAALGGRVWVEDRPGGGSCFIVEIEAR